MTTFTATADNINLVAGVPTTLWELGTGPYRDAFIRAWSVEFNGVSATDEPVKCEFRRSSSGVTTALALTPLPKDIRSPAVSEVVFKFNTSTEGAGTLNSGEIHRVHPQGGLQVRYPRGEEWHVASAVMQFFRLRCTAAQGVRATFFVEWEE